MEAIRESRSWRVNGFLAVFVEIVLLAVAVLIFREMVLRPDGLTVVLFVIVMMMLCWKHS